MKNVLIFCAIFFLFISCADKIIDTEICVIPHPASVEIYKGVFKVAGADFKVDEKFDTSVRSIVADFESKLVSASGKISGTSGTKILFMKDDRKENEEYSVEISPRKVVIKSSSQNGVIYAIETLKQMLPEEIYVGTSVKVCSWELPCMKIEDKPRFSYRGMHLDVSRHFFGIDEVKRYIDIMAIHKLNVLHWHLTDDQGWRLEIKKYPQLTQIGAIRKKTVIGHISESNEYDNIRYGVGLWYSQEQVLDIVNYAKNKGIDIIPEIDLPGHMLAALATFPEFGCTGGPYEVWGRWGIADDVLCVGKEITMKFLEDVLSEVADLFPSEYIHIGGDECPKICWEKCPYCQAKIKELGFKDDEKFSAEHYLQAYVMNRMEAFLAKKGKKIIGWDEILEGTLGPDATVMSWRGTEGGIAAARLGHDAIMVPSSKLYFDYYQSKDIEHEPLAIGGYVPVEGVYSYEPYEEGMSDKEKKHIIGVQANMWTEYICTDSYLEYMLLPRMSALSEVQWCMPENKNYNRFLENIKHMSKIYDILNYNYARHIFSE